MRSEREMTSDRPESARHALFVVGRIRKGEQKLVFPEVARQTVFPGPWQVRAVLVD